MKTIHKLLALALCLALLCGFRTSAIRISVCDFETLIEQSDAQSGCAISCAQSCTRMQRFSAIATSSLSTITSEIWNMVDR